MSIKKYLSPVLFVLLAAVLSSCGTTSVDSSKDGLYSMDKNTGRLSLSLCDAPAPEYKAVYVTIAEIQVCRAGSGDEEWQTILTPNSTYNLLKLINGNTVSLGIAELSTGAYSQIRLILSDDADSTLNVLGLSHPFANYLVTSADESFELKVPSGFQTGIKLVHGFEIEAGRTVSLLLDFDASRSVVKAGNSGKWILKPTIKVLGTLNNALIEGTVTNQALEPVPGALISAQIYDAMAQEEDVVTIYTSTITDEYGKYLMYLEPGTYNIVAYKEGFGVSAAEVTVEYDNDYIKDFILEAAAMALIGIDLKLPEDGSDQTAEIRFMQPFQGGSIEVVHAGFSGSGLYDVSLPVGNYYVLAFYTGKLPLSFVDVATGSSITIDFTDPD